MIQSSNGSPTAIFSKLGWLVLGGYSTRVPTKQVRFDASVIDNEGKSNRPPYRKRKHIQSGSWDAPQDDFTWVLSKPSLPKVEQLNIHSFWIPLPQRVYGPGFRYSANRHLRPLRPLAPPTVCTLHSSRVTTTEPHTSPINLPSLLPASSLRSPTR